MPVHYGRQMRRSPALAGARRLAGRRSLSPRVAMEPRRPLARRGLHHARFALPAGRHHVPLRAPVPYARRFPAVARPAATAPAPQQRRSAVFAWSLVAAGIAVWGMALSGVTAWSPARAPVAPAIAAPVVPQVQPPREEPDAEYAAVPGMRENVWRAIANATEVVGVDAGYMTAVAARESGFDPTVRAEGTTATGLYQFTQDTWLRAVKFFGARHGLGELARQITIDEFGDLSVRPGARAKLLQLRNDPKLSALMAAELARDNKARLERLLGRDVTPAETYMAHFLGVGQAARIIDAAHSRPHISGARLLPAAARSNPAVFAPAGHDASAAAIVGKIEAYFNRDVSPSARI